MKTLTPRQREVLEFVARFLNAEGRAPTIRQIVQHFQIPRVLEAFSKAPKLSVEKTPG